MGNTCFIGYPWENGKTTGKPRETIIGQWGYPPVICYIAIEHCPVEIVKFPMKPGDFP